MSVAITLYPTRQSFLMSKLLVWVAAAGLVLATVFAGVSDVTAQEKSVFGNDELYLPFEPHGFVTEKKPSQLDPDVLGAKGQGDYTLYHQHFSLITPDEDVLGLWTVFRVTQVMCRALYRGEKSLVKAAPKGFVIARDDIHALGSERPGGWGGRGFAVTKSGDSLTDAASGHPFWYVRYGDDGNLHSCGVELGSPTGKKADAGEDPGDEAKRASVIRFLYVGVPQIFFGIITDPVLVGFGPPGPRDAITLTAPCGGAWCRILILYDFGPGRWYVSSTIDFGDPLRLE